MRLARLLSLIATCLIAVTLVAPSAAAEPPFRLPDYVTDNAGVLSDRQLADVQKSVDQLYSERHVRLWVVFVESFAPQGAVGWAQQTRTVSDLGNEDAILAVATGQRSYAFLVPAAASGGTSAKVDDIRRDRIEPALRNSDWAGAASAAASGLAAMRSGGGRSVPLAPILVVAGIGLLAIGALMLWNRRRRGRRHKAAVNAAKQLDPTDAAALAAVPIDALDELSRSMVVDVDNAVRTSANELALAVEEFGAAQTAPFAAAVDNAREALKQAFTVRQRLDDDVPDPLPERRDLLTRVVVSAARANRELTAQTEAFHQMRDLVINAPERLDGLTRQLVTVTARIDPSEKTLTGLHTEFAETALASVARNVIAARERLGFADQTITRGRELAAKPVAGEVGELVDCVRGAESALQQANTMLDAVDSAATDIRRAVTALPAAIEDIQRGIGQAAEQLAQGGLAKSATSDQLSAARDAAVEAVAAAQSTGTADPLGAFTRLTQADADLDRLLAEVAEERDAAERLARSYEQAVFTARSRVRSVSDYIDTRRGSIGPDARTRLNEAVRQLEAAQSKAGADITEAIAHANGASLLAAQAQQLANDDVQAGQRQYQARYRGGQSDMGAMVGGIILGNILTGGMGGGLGGGGWTSTSYGGSQSGGDLLGGGGRF